MWSTINEIINFKKRKTKNAINQLKIGNNLIVKDPPLIAETLNDYFINI